METHSLKSKSRARLTSGSPPTQTNHAMIEMLGVVKTFVNAAGRFTALKGIDLTIQPGEFVSIVGKSGSGKSTLLNMITGIDFPTEGQVVVSGTDIYTGVSESQRSRWRGRNLGIVFQFFQLLPMLTLLENVMLPMDFAEMYAFEERPARALELLQLVGLEDFKDTLPAFVSNGQQQLAAIARALACDPPLLVADEPTGNLDHKSSVIIVDLFEQLARQGKTILMVTHDPDMSSRTTRSIIISDGELIDEQVARALPWLPDGELLQLSKIARQVTLHSGEVLNQQKQVYSDLFILRSGQVEISKSGFGGRQTILGHIGPGSAIGEVEIIRRQRSQFTAAAAEKGLVELLAIPAESFRHAVQAASIPAARLEKILDEKQARFKETKRTRKSKG